VPIVQGVARCLVPDLLGFGESGKEPDKQYRFHDQYRYLCAWLSSIKVDGKVILVGQGMGSMLAFHWAHQHAEKVKAVIYIEGIPAPLRNYDDIADKTLAELYRDIRNDDDAAAKLVEDSHFLEAFLADNNNSEVDFAEYQKPFIKSDHSRLAALRCVQDLPILEEGPTEVTDLVTAYSMWLASSSIPKLHVYCENGPLSRFAKEVTAEWTNQNEVTVCGGRLPQEGSSGDIGKAIVTFIKEHITYDPTNHKDIHVRWFD